MDAIATNILLIGPPRCGKTTVIGKVIDGLAGWRLAGFCTEEVRDARSRRLGFEAIGLGGTRCVLAHVDFRSRQRVGRYGVQVREFEGLVEEEFVPDEGIDLIIIDEIRKMECFSGMFVEAARRALDGPVPVLATIAQKGSGLAALTRCGTLE